MDCLFLHVPKFENEYLPLGEFINITYMPMGLPALAELVHRRGFSTEIIHLGIEWLHKGDFSILDELKDKKIRAIGLPLYWHYQSYDVLRVASAIKEKYPEIFLFLGGLTASYFAEEIMKEFSFIDAVLCGHAEGILPLLLDELKHPRSGLDNVPSVYYRQDGSICRSSKKYLASEEDLNELVFADLSLLRNYKTYVRYFGFPLALSKEYDIREHSGYQTMGRTFFPLCTGRGCPTSCSYCGGNLATLTRANGLGRPIWRSHKQVIKDIRKALDFGYRTMSLCFDPLPEDESYYVGLFREIRRKKLPVDFYFECWGLPTQLFLEEFARTFRSGDSYIAVSPDSGNEAIRRMNKGFYYSNEELLLTIENAEKLNIPVDVFFTLALPGETLKTARETAQLIELIRSRFANIRRLMTWTVQLEPGSPQFEDPAAFGMITDRKSFMDYYNAHGGDRADTYSSLGYKICGYFGDERDNGSIADFEMEVQHLKCMEFCFLSPDPRIPVTPEEGRTHCLERRVRIAQRKGLQIPESAINESYRYQQALKDLKTPESDNRAEYV